MGLRFRVPKLYRGNIGDTLGILEKKMEFRGLGSRVYGGFTKSRVPFWGPNNKDYNILGSILGPLFLENYHVPSAI